MVVPPVQGTEDIFSISCISAYPCIYCIGAIPQHHFSPWLSLRQNRSHHPSYPFVWAKGPRQLVSRGAEFLTHLFPLLGVPQNVISSTIETFALELLLLLLLLPLATLALALLLRLVLDGLDNFFHFISVHCQFFPLFVSFLTFSGSFFPPPTLTPSPAPR